MIIDTSAVVAILKHEPGSERIATAIERSAERRISAGTLLELDIVADRNEDLKLSRQLDQFIDLIQPTVEPVTEIQTKIARQAYREFGRGTGHPARLNFGDCFAYALARERNEPLLFVGDDFIHTDIRSALDV